MKKIFVSSTASSSFLKDLNSNGIKYSLIKGFTQLEAEDCDKLNLAIRMVKERFGSQSIVIKS